MTNRNYNLTADSAGGGCIQGFTGVELVIDEPSLYALDILEAPRLETITIKNLASGKPPHLVLGNLTALRQVKLPGSHPGAVIHLHSHSAPAPLEISGPAP
ncbi:MAG: hypothetical protein R6W86_16485 [Marinobacter sp.]|uniref:hypothetical protein n=1 Tax=Marinobacter sp. TaxID=50741 RepID=UPI00396DD252